VTTTGQEYEGGLVGRREGFPDNNIKIEKHIAITILRPGGAKSFLS